MPSLYIKNNYIVDTPKAAISGHSSVEKGVISMSKDVNGLIDQISGHMTQNASFLLAYQIIGDRPPSSSVKRIGRSRQALIKTTKVNRVQSLNRNHSNSKQQAIQSMNVTANSSAEKLRRTFVMNKAHESDNAANQGSNRYTNNLETTVQWRDDIKLSIEDEITFTSCLGQGSFAKVYEGHDKINKLNVAIKVIDKRKIIEPKRRNLIQAEISILAKMKNKNIGEFYRLIEDHKRIFIVMQLCGRLTLNHFCRQFNGKRLNEEQAYAVFSQIAKGVKYMHDQGIAHRDLKLTNILIDDEYTVKIIDFGFACGTKDKHKMYCGTPSYMAPEIVEKKLYYAKPSDVWSLGVVFYKLLTGEYAFGGMMYIM